MRVHFVCRGNALRSVMAEAYLKSLNIPGVEVWSSGTIAERARVRNEPTLKTTGDFLGRKGLGAFAKRRAEQLTQERLDESDITVCMNQIVYDEGSVELLFPAATIIWNVADAGEGERVLASDDAHTKYDESIYDEIKEKVDELAMSVPLVGGLSPAG